VLSDSGKFFVRWRVRAGYLLAIFVLWFAWPVPRSILYGAAIGIVGLLIRAYAAGYLHKQEVLTVTGPYAYTRNPLYLGSSLLALGAGAATRSWISAALLLVYFAVFYSMVMRREELELRQRHGTAFDVYAKTVPLFFPRLSAGTAMSGAEGFSLTQYKKNREWKAALGFLLLLGILLVIWRLRMA
jgi:protein-S-isoprenylcysteine O-methyltransferase Ste14